MMDDVCDQAYMIALYWVFKWHTTLRQYSKLPIMKPVKHVVLQCVYGN